MDNLSDADRYYMLDTIILGSCQHLRKVFRTHWKTQTQEKWKNDDNHKQALLSSLPLSKAKKCQLSPSQQKAIKEKSLGDWDITLLAAILVLQHKTNDDICKAVKSLKALRNSLAHVDTGKSSTENAEEKCFRKCSAEEFELHLKETSKSLRILGMEDCEIQKMLQKPGEDQSFKALRRVQNLYRKAERLVKKKKLNQAIDQISDAIATPNLFPEHLGEAYEKRGELYLKKLGNRPMDDDLRNQTRIDIQKAMEINSSSWQACNLAGQYYELENKLSLAVSYYKTAFNLSPSQKAVKQNLELCKWLDALQKRHDHFNHLPMNEQERVNDWIEKTGIHMTEEEYAKCQRESAAKRIPGQDHVFKGHQYRFGWWKEKDFEKAAKHYSIADTIGNPEGSYNLAFCYLEGKGVERDVDKALAIFRRVALMDEDTIGTYTYLGKNIGVSAAEYIIGLFYDNGTFFEKDFVKAAVWYRKAMETGTGHACNNLARLYVNGTGVSQDNVMAKMCWQQGVNLRELNSAASLVEYYLDHMEPELACEMLKIGREMGNYWLSKWSDEEFQTKILGIKAERDYLSPEVINFERIYGLHTKGLTFGERCERICDISNFQFALYPKSVLEMKKYLQSPVRKEHILTHRKELNKIYYHFGKTTVVKNNLTFRPKLQQRMTHGLSVGTQIYLNEMNPTVDNIFVDRVLHLTIIEDPNPEYFSINLIAEDDNGDTTRLYIYNVGRDEETLNKFQVGSRISIRNPYMRIGAGSINHGIRNDEPKCITYFEKVEKMCRFCGEGNAQRKCAVCKRPYCSKNCQKLDWKTFQHKLICVRKNI